MEKISKLEAIEVRVPLPEPVLVGTTVFKVRTYTVVKITTENGIVGVGYSYSRGLPIKEIVLNMLAPLVIGSDIENSEQLRLQILATYWHSAEHGTFTAAVSAVDIAIWDALGKLKNKSVAQLLGKKRNSLPVSYVIGYKYGNDESGLIRDVEQALSRGIRNFKMVVGAGTAERDAQRMKAVRQLVGPKGRIGVDAFRSLKGIDDATERVVALQPYDLDFMEDPFLESQGLLAIELRERTGVRIAFGESQFGHRGIANLVVNNYVDLVRVDALIVGGIQEFLLSAKVADEKNLQVSTHIHSEIHAPLAAAIENLYEGGLEYMDPILDVDLVHLLMQNPIQINDGEFQISDEPGFGVNWDWNAIKKFSEN